MYSIKCTSPSIQYSIVLWVHSCTVLYCTVLYCTLLYCTIHCIVSAVLWEVAVESECFRARLWEDQCTLYSVHCTLYTVQCTMYNGQCTLYIVHCTLYNVHFTLYTVHRTLCTVHCTVQLEDQWEEGSNVGPRERPFIHIVQESTYCYQYSTYCIV